MRSKPKSLSPSPPPVISQGLGGPIWHDGWVSLAILWVHSGGNSLHKAGVCLFVFFFFLLELNSLYLGNRKSFNIFCHCSVYWEFPGLAMLIYPGEDTWAS